MTHPQLYIIAMLMAGPFFVNADTLLMENREDYEINLSALVIYGQSGRVILLQPGTDIIASKDNQVFKPDAIKTFSFTGNKQFFLFGEFYAPQHENLSVFSKLPSNTPVKIVYGVASKLRDSVVVRIEEQGIKLLPMDNESLFNFTEGKNPQLPGFFVGTGLDDKTGRVTGAYTGSVIFLNGFTVIRQP